MQIIENGESTIIKSVLRYFAMRDEMLFINIRILIYPNTGMFQISHNAGQNKEYYTTKTTKLMTD